MCERSLGGIESVCCLLVFYSVTFTPQWIHQPEAAWLCVWCLVLLCKYVLRHSRVSHPLNLWLCLLQHLGFLLRLMPPRPATDATFTHTGSSAGRRRGSREGACTGAATMSQTSTLRLILNAATVSRPRDRLCSLTGKNAVHYLTGCVCLLLQYLLQSCSRGGGGGGGGAI